jgi:hypothetical protein
MILANPGLGFTVQLPRVGGRDRALAETSRHATSGTRVALISTPGVQARVAEFSTKSWKSWLAMAGYYRTV